jgi:integrase
MSIIKPRGRFRGHEVIDEKRKHLEPAELSRLFSVLKNARDDYFGPFWYGYFRLQYYFGCRISEIAILLKEDVSFEERMIIIRRLKKRRFKKDENGVPEEIGPGYEECVYGLPDLLVGPLQDVLKDHPKKGISDRNPWFFASRITQRLPKQESDRMAQIRRIPRHPNGFWRAVSRDNADEHFRVAARRAEIPERLCHSHVLRHTRATLMLAEGAPEEDVKFLLGHTSINTTRRYLGLAKTLRLRLQTSAELGLGDLSEF